MSEPKKERLTSGSQTQSGKVHGQVRLAREAEETQRVQDVSREVKPIALSASGRRHFECQLGEQNQFVRREPMPVENSQYDHSVSEVTLSVAKRRHVQRGPVARVYRRGQVHVQHVQSLDQGPVAKHLRLLAHPGARLCPGQELWPGRHLQMDARDRVRQHWLHLRPQVHHQHLNTQIQIQSPDSICFVIFFCS